MRLEVTRVTYPPCHRIRYRSGDNSDFRNTSLGFWENRGFLVTSQICVHLFEVVSNLYQKVPKVCTYRDVMTFC